jgi:hypothetical protein
MANKQAETAPAAGPEIDLAETIRRVSDGLDRLLRSGLTRRAVVILLKHETGVPMGHVEAVLGGLEVLAKRYTIPKP